MGHMESINKLTSTWTDLLWALLFIAWGTVNCSQLIFVHYHGRLNFVALVQLLSHGLASLYFFGAAIAYLIRKTTQAKDNRPHVVAISIVTTLLPLSFNFLAFTNQKILSLVSTAGLCSGLVISTISLFALKTAFSVTPEARYIVTRFPYNIVRHPMYLGEIIAALFLAIATASFIGLSIFLIMVLLQRFRARLEEDLLCKTYPGYRDYIGKVPAFLPIKLWKSF